MIVPAAMQVHLNRQISVFWGVSPQYKRLILMTLLGAVKSSVDD
jgi:hypothetical protein